MKKKLVVGLALLMLVAGGAAAGFYFSQSERRFSKHIEKARILLKQNQFEAARKEYQAAYQTQGGYNAHISEEVLKFEVGMMRREGRLQDAIAETNLFLEAAGTASGEAPLLLAGLHLDARQFDSAFLVLNRIIEEKPDAVEPRAMLAQIRNYQGRPDLAEAQYRRMAASHPDSVPVLLMLAEQLERAPDQSERRALFRRALAKQPLSRSARLGLIDTWLREGAIDSASASLDSWSEADTASAREVALRRSRLLCLTDEFDAALAVLRPYQDSTAESAPVDFEASLILARKGDWEAAIRSYEELAHRHPGSAGGARVLQGLLHLVRSEAAQALGAVKQIDPSLERPENLQVAVYAYAALGQSEKAKEALASRTQDVREPLEEFLAQAANNSDFIGRWAQIQFFLAAKVPSAALRAANALRRAYPKNPLGFSAVSRLYGGLGKADSAYQVLAAHPNPSPEQRLAMAQHLMGSGKPAGAKTLLEGLRASNPQMRTVNRLLADMDMVQGRRREAMASYQKELELDPDNLIALNNLAWEYGVVLRDLEAAKPFLRRLEKLKFSDARIFDTIGWIFVVNGRPAEGLPYLREALGLIPDSPTLLYHLAYALEKSGGNRNEAKSLLRKALDKPWTWDEKGEAQQFLDSLP